MYPPDKRGWASSAQVYRSSHMPGFQWNASGPGGMTSGTAATEAEAWEKARRAQRQLDRVLPRPRGIG